MGVVRGDHAAGPKRAEVDFRVVGRCVRALRDGFPVIQRTKGCRLGFEIDTQIFRGSGSVGCDGRIMRFSGGCGLKLVPMTARRLLP